MQFLDRPQGRLITVLVSAALAVFGVTLTVTSGPDSLHPGHHKTTVTITTANNKRVTAPIAAVDRAGGVNAERGLSGDGNAASQHSSDMANPDAPVVSGPVPLASPFQTGCLTRSNTSNYSYRNGTKPSIIPIHLTVSPNVVGWSDVNGVDVFLNRPSTSASANYIIDNEGHCIYAVAETYKAWAQVSYNSASACAIEIINTGSEATYAATAGVAKLARVVHDCAHRWNIPLQRASVSGGRVLRAGVIDHFHLGLAGGGHVDIHNFGDHCVNRGPGADTWACVDFVIAAAKALDGPHLKPTTATQRKACYELNGIRRRAGRTGHWLPRGRANQIKTNEKKHHLVCRAGKHPRLLRVA